MPATLLYACIKQQLDNELCNHASKVASVYLISHAQGVLLWELVMVFGVHDRAVSGHVPGSLLFSHVHVHVCTLQSDQVVNDMYFCESTNLL